LEAEYLYESDLKFTINAEGLDEPELVIPIYESNVTTMIDSNGT
jgi:hypothetical protein